MLSEPWPTVRSVRERVGLASADTVHGHLERLRRDDLVKWERFRRGTLRPLVRVVPFGVADSEAEAS